MDRLLPAPEVLVTGATGFIGRWLLAALTARGDAVVALVRNARDREGELRAFVDRIGGVSARLSVVEGDVEREGLGLARELPDVHTVFHLAARFAFGLRPDDARKSNVGGTVHALDWAARQRALRRFVFLGGYRMTTGPGSEPTAARFERLYAKVGAYEASKHEALAVFRRTVKERSIPWTAVHPSGVIGDSRTGETTQTVGLGETVRRLHERTLPALAGSRRTFVPVVTVDYLAAFLASVHLHAETEGQDLVVFDPATPTLPELVADIAKHLGVSAPECIVPLWLVRSLPASWTGLDRESLGFLSEDRYDTAPALAHADRVGLEHPDLDQALARWSAYLVSTRWLGQSSPA